MLRIVITTMTLMLLFIVIGVPIACYKSSCYEAKIYNDKNGTNYTCSDFFWAGKQINSQTQTITKEDLDYVNSLDSWLASQGY